MANAAPNGRYDIVISGASYAGLALARALSQALEGSARIALVDRRPVGPRGSAPDARAFALSAGSKRMLEILGVWGLVADAAQPVAAIEITDSSLDAGVRPVLLTYENAVEGGEPASYIVPAGPLNDALAEVVAGDGGIEIVAPEEIASFVGDAALDLTFAGGAAVKASLLIAADGRNSPLRGMAGIKSVGRSYPQTGIVTTVAHAKPHNGHAVQHFLPGGPFAILPLPGNRACITWTEEADEARRILALDDAAFLEEVDKRFGGKLGTLSLAGPRQSWPLELHLARSYIAPRFAVVGDAAHVVHPIAGQGLNLALRDAAALTEAITDAARLGLDLGSAQALERYERWRRFDAAMSTAAFDGLNVLFSNDLTLLRAARDVGLGLVNRSPMLKQLFVAEAAGITGDVPRLLRGEAV
ncbi:MAG: FAD-dependent monooxygenase [Hyphomicrobiaceae bacterium]|nr:FAD-dependent monooxygenase [Hyphomicrobiaceae bacterium]